MSVTANEQYAIELLNRARLDPAGEAARYGLSLNEGLAAGTITDTPKQVLAPFDVLALSASRHSEWMIDTDTFSHTGIGNSQPDQRMKSAGYEFSGGWSWGENLALASLTQGRTFSNVIDTHHAGLMDSALHRVNIMRDSFREIGYSQAVGTFQGYETSVVTENFAHRSDRIYVTGVAYNDRNHDNFYSQGEGESGLKFSIRGGDSTSTASAGGYGLLADQSKNVVVDVTDGNQKSQVQLDVSSGNVKLDVVNGDTFFTSSHTKLVSGIDNARLLGIANLSLVGNNDSNRLTGNDGNNKLRGNAGNDRLDGGDGRDRLYGGDDNDLLRGGKDNDKLGGDGGNDKLFGQGGRDQLDGGNGNDRVNGGGGNDKLLGKAGSDKLYGGSGDDVLTGGTGNDRMLGGKGADTFVFTHHDGRDKIVDFNTNAGDDLRLDHDLWNGALSAKQVVSQFADVTSKGIMLDFGGGDSLLLTGFKDLNGLAAHIDIF